MRRLAAAAGLALLCAVPCAAAPDAPVVAVLSSDLGAFREALRGFEAGFGQKVPVVKASDRAKLPAGTRVVAAFGGRAAAKPYRSGVFVISCLAPGLPRDPAYGARVRMVPPPDTLLAAIHAAQPKARDVAVFFLNPAFDDYARELDARAARFGLDVMPMDLEDRAQLPEALRSILGEVDAVWVAPDPDLINERTFALLREFSRSGRLPLYAPTLELVKEGATAAIAVSYFEAGRAAGLAAKRALAGEKVPPRIYAEKVDVVVNGAQAAADGVVVSTGVESIGLDPARPR